MTASSFLILGTYLAILAVLSVYGLHRLFIAAVYLRHRSRPPQPGAFHRLPHVTVQLPVFNERNVVERLIDAACQLDWPTELLEIQVLDDSTDDSVAVAEAAAARWRSRGVDILVLHRAVRPGFKAGALAAGTLQAKGEFLAVFDADFVPPPDFLRQAMPHFAGQPGVGMVQARWGHINEAHSLLTRLSAVLLDGHFVLEHTARHRSGRFFNFNGTAGIWRRQAITDAGGWQHDTLTEDLDLSYRAQLKGWRFVFLKDLVVPAELPEDMRAFKTQQHRWAKGTMQTARKLVGPIMRSDQPLRVRAEALVHLSSNLAYPGVLLMAVLMPISVAIRGRGDLTQALLLDLPAFLCATMSIAFFYGLAEREAWGGWTERIWRVPLTMALGIGMAVNQSRAVIEGLWGSDVTFVRTPKSGDAPVRAYRTPITWTPVVELAFAAYFAFGVVLSLVEGYWASVPFMALFGWGFGFVGIQSVRAGRPRVSAGPDEPARVGAMAAK